ncbi:ABC transporter ATP-binding protein [Comamonas endophytica]|uniref:ABC transporter ATP-binding protein n=1 Tax=Comamonas endophytica TaxID=2949090 RepID=A0ABY6GDH8_9BURK|nr:MULTISPECIES: ABC transporter ATP-binding protein [unclassified Acidovorax]MCD2512689.1 ABC transporter ATP-binding protein [Acidovorax sp. D4N7]UYG52956.1 ABC transporter ATP-binding protein [Acidovorax sp. 5MLIR]
MKSSSLDIESITQRFGNFTALDDVSISINPGEILALLGPSGCGKTSLLRIVAGFARQTAGAIRIDGRTVDDLQPNARNIGLVFQNYALFPHMTVIENVAYGLQARKESPSLVMKRAMECLEIVQLPHARDRYPRQLSGGQQQRVALARAIATRPQVLLLDEPFSALDKNLRLDMQLEIKRLQRQLGITAILVTHDQEEAMTVADKVAVMNQGKLEQLDTAVNIYDRPKTLFVNQFVGNCNQIQANVISSGSGFMQLRIADGKELAVPWTGEGFPAGKSVILTIRPEQLEIASSQRPGFIPARRILSTPLGGNAVHQIQMGESLSVKSIHKRSALDADLPGDIWIGLSDTASPRVFAV